MKPARLVVLGIAVVAGGLAALLAAGDRSPPAAPAPVAQIDTVEVLVAAKDIDIGQSIAPSDMQWMTWPASAGTPAFIKRNERPNAIEELVGAIARVPSSAGEPIREGKLIKAKGSGYMAAILPSGMRAVSTEISPETGAGGFILPNDRVDVILSKRDKNPERSGSDAIQTEVILSNVRVLAIDQAPKEKEGSNTLVGRTATLELKPEQAETLVRARQSGTLALALRSITDGNATAEGQSEEQVNVVRYGIANQTTAQK
jgi:pilus assembly protein CpaB